MYEEYLAHYGVLGMRWGVRKNRKKYYNRTVFVSGSSKTQNKESPYYRKKLNKKIKTELNRTIKAKGRILVGDAPGIDRQVQNYLKKKHYKNVAVYSPGLVARYLANKKWMNVKIDSSEFEEGSKEFLAKKDIAMTNDAKRGLAVILDEGSKATRNNIDRLISQNKDVFIFEIDKRGKKYDKQINRR